MRLTYGEGLSHPPSIAFKAVQLFYQDLQLTREMNVDILPTFIIRKKGQVVERLTGGIDLRNFESVILRLDPTLHKTIEDVSPVEVFKR